MKTFVCGTCGKRFSVNDTPRGCPVCWSEHVTLVTAEYRAACKEDAIKNHKKELNDLIVEIREINSQKKKLMKEYPRHRNCLYQYAIKGEFDKNDIPKI